MSLEKSFFTSTNSVCQTCKYLIGRKRQTHFKKRLGKDKLIFKKDLFMFMYISVLPACLYKYCVHDWCPWRPEDRVLDHLTGAQAVVSYHMGTGTKPGSSRRATSAHNY